MTRRVCSATVLTIWSLSRLCTIAGATCSSMSSLAARPLRRLWLEPAGGAAPISGGGDAIRQGLVVLGRAAADTNRPDHRLGVGADRRAAGEAGEGRITIDQNGEAALLEPVGQ